MIEKQSLQRLRSSVDLASRGVNGIGMTLLMGMMLLIVVDVFLRRVFSRPIMGSFEIVQFTLCVLVYLGLAYTTIQKAHISVDLLVTKLSEGTRVLIESLTLLLSLGFFILITWRNIPRGRELWLEKATSALLSIPTFPFYYVLAFGCGLLCLVLLVQMIDTCSKVFRLVPKVRAAVLYLCGLAPLFVLFALSFHLVEWEMNPVIAGILGIAALFALMAVGMPIGFAMGLVGFAGYCYIVSVDAGISQLESVPFDVGSDYILAVVPLFLLMGHFAFHSGLSQDLYDTFYKWLGQYPGGLAMATVGGCAAFAAVSGSSVATAATMGTVALPAMRKYKYSDRLALGSIAAGGTVGILIPPSIVFILYGILTEQSIGELFMAGFLPGALAVLLYFSVIFIQVRVNPQLGPAGPKTNLKEKILSLRNTWGMLLLFALVMGGIYLGFFTPTEAGAVGAFGSFLIALLRRRLTWQTLYSSLLETGRTTAMLIIIFVGAMIFNYFMAVSNLPTALAELITEHNLSKYAILTAILILYLLLGCIMDPGSMIILTIPIVYPIIRSIGFDPIWFGVIIVMVAEIGTITPPVGLNVFVVAGVAKNTSIEEVFKGIIPFWGIDMLRLIILVAIPQISLFLPNIMK